jgi:tetrapyrrole methylase family protein / MazG family protein
MTSKNPPSELALKDSFESLVKVVHRLRAPGPGGCPWDQKQTHQSLRPYFVEETYETLECLDEVDSPTKLGESPKLRDHLVEELGDVLLQILLHSEIASESGAFSIVDVVDGLEKKLIRRHPHVFGEVKIEDEKAVLKQWDELKAKEKSDLNRAKDPNAPIEADPEFVHLLDSIPKGLPPIPRTLKVIEKVSKVGFQWGEVTGALEKMEEEVREFRVEIENKNTSAIEDELGDVLFSTCNVAFLAKADPEAALRRCLRKFESRFRHIETGLHRRGKKISESNLTEMDEFWNEAKKIERQNSGGNP